MHPVSSSKPTKPEITVSQEIGCSNFSMSISVENEDPVAFLLNEKLEKLKPVDDRARIERSGCDIICRVPENIRKANKSLYEPRMVSIGPYYHHLREHRLREMEGRKMHLLSSFLGRKSEIPLQTYVKELRLLEDQVRESYSETIPIESNDFVQMLLLDGCFILEHFWKWEEVMDNHKERDTLLGENWTTILSDIVLSENQIPLVVIERLYDIAKIGEASYNRNRFLTDLVGFLTKHRLCRYREWPQTTRQLSHIYHHSLIRKVKMKEDYPTLTGLRLLIRKLKDFISYYFNSFEPTPVTPQIPSATELDEVGVKFRKKDWLTCPFDVEFKGGIFDIPSIKISYDTKVFLANLVQVERHYGWPNQVVTSYVTLMDLLIKRKEDLVLLQHALIIDNQLSTDQEAVDFFHQLCDTTKFDPEFQFFMELFGEVQMYYNSGWNRHRTAFVRNYCNSPSTAISVIAGMTLLGLSVLQTFYAVFSYCRPR